MTRYSGEVDRASASTAGGVHQSLHQQQHQHQQQQQHHSHSHNDQDPSADTASERHAPTVSTTLTSNVIEKCDSPDDTSSIEGSVRSPVEPETSSSSNSTNDQDVLKKLDEYEFVVGVSEDRNRRCRRTMEVCSNCKGEGGAIRLDS